MQMSIWSGCKLAYPISNNLYFLYKNKAPYTYGAYNKPNLVNVEYQYLVQFSIPTKNCSGYFYSLIDSQRYLIKLLKSIRANTYFDF